MNDPSMIRLKMIFYIILFLMILKLTKCSTVLDSLSQNTIYVTAYCPRMKYCREGTHVMCMYYNHDRVVGPLCRNYVPVKITPTMVQQILRTVNEIRGNIALGKETGKNDQLLPRAYGMMRMQWDSELATLAQVLANQCLGLKEDDCRATEKFPNPSQIITLVNFKIPDWQYFSRNTTVRGLNDEKLSFSIDKALRSLHGVKRTMTDETINYCPILENLPDMGSRSYLKLIHGRATHIGCGISAYTRYHAADNNAQNIYNSVQMVCNISEGPQPSQPLYTTDPPIPETGYSDVCGCPSGFREIKDCLCEVNPYYTSKKKVNHVKPVSRPPQTMKIPTKKVTTEQCDKHTGKCDPKIVFLPIFEIQDAPSYSDEMGNDNEVALQHRFNKSYVRSETMEETELSEEKYKELLDATKRNLNKNPQRRYSSSRHDPKTEFKAQDNAVTSDEVKFDTDFNSADDSLIGNKQYSRKNNDYEDTFNVNDLYKDTDNSFMSLLDVLERAVQNIELDGEEKEIFDIKMRKIYETVINTNKKQEPEPAQIENDFLELKNYLKHKSRDKIEDYDPDDWQKVNRKSSIQAVEKDMNLMNNYNYMDRKDSDVFEEQNNGIDDRLIDILSKKGYENQLDRKYELDPIIKNANADVYNIDRLYDNSYDYTHTPAPRKQETIVKYHKDLKKATKAPKRTEYKNVITKNINNDRRGIKKYYFQKRENENKNKMKTNTKNRQTLNVKPMKPIGRRTFTYPGKTKGKNTHKNPPYRRILETEHERPMRPVRPNHSTSLKKSTKFEPDRYYISDRATY